MTVMHPKLAPFFQGREQFYPRHLEANYSRIFNKIIGMWGTPELDAFINDLFVDKRGGRQGFPAEVMNDILVLSRIHERMQQMKAEGARKKEDAWNNESLRRALQGEQIDFTKEGFFRAIELNNERAVQIFIRGGIDLEVKNAGGWTPLIAAAAAGNLNAAKALIEAGADVNARDSQGLTALHWAAFKGYPRVTELLADKGADVNAKSNMGLTPLSQAAVWGHAEVVEVLLLKGANVDDSDGDGLTPLHKAVSDGHAAVVKLLVAAGADREAKTPRGLTPAAIAKQKNNPAVIAALSI
jgi:hypothetical protein